MLHHVGRSRFQRTPDPTVESELGASDRVDDDACRVGRVFDAESRLQVHGDVAEALPLDPQEAHLVVLLPGDVVGGTDVDLVIGQPDLEL